MKIGDGDTEALLLKLNVIISLLLDHRPPEVAKRSLTEKALALSDMGLGTREISEVLGKPSKDVSTLLRQGRKPKKGKAASG